MSDNQHRASSEGEVRQVVESWAGAVRRKDLHGILANHSPDLVMFDVPPPLQSKGIDAYRRTWDVFFSWSRDPVVFDVREMRVTAGDGVAFVAATMHCAGTERSGEQVELDFRLTVGLQKVDGRWTVVHEHHSIPALSEDTRSA